MEDCTKGRKHHFTLRAPSVSGRSYRFRCTNCQLRAIVYKSSFWRGIHTNVIFINRFEEKVTV